MYVGIWYWFWWYLELRIGSRFMKKMLSNLTLQNKEKLHLVWLKLQKGQILGRELQVGMRPFCCEIFTKIVPLFLELKFFCKQPTGECWDAFWRVDDRAWESPKWNWENQCFNVNVRWRFYDSCFQQSNWIIWCGFWRKGEQVDAKKG